MNKQSNSYTIIYIIVMVLVTGVALAYAAMALKPQQQANADADKMKQILASVHIAAPDNGDIVSEFDKYIVESYLVNSDGKRVDGDEAFNVDVAKQYKEPAAARQLPVFVARLDDGSTKYILPMYGAGLWGPIWGYISLNDDGSTIYGAYFSHQGETPGLGAEIAKPDFQNQFNDKRLFVDGTFGPIQVLKHGMAAPGSPNQVNGISGGTITSKGVSSMIDNCITPYKPYLQTLSSK